jgi:multidrug efflux pump subunit AcrA (membrane-fusion protein)
VSELRALPTPDEVSEPVNELFQELPPSVARGLLYVLLGLLLAAGLYAAIGQVDDIVSARATVVPRGLVRPLQAANSGRVTHVAVQEGDRVDENQVLVYLETEAAQAQLEQAHEEQAIRQRQLQEALVGGTARVARGPDGPGSVDAMQIAEARARLTQADAAEAAAQRALDASMIVAPTAGQVTRLAVHGIGETVQAGQTVAEVAPAGAPLVFQARVANNDVGRVRVGQRATIKVDAYPYQAYGTLEGNVQFIGADAVAERDELPGYRVIVVPAPRPSAPGADAISLRLGLSATVEIVTERRRIIELFLRRVRG